MVINFVPMKRYMILIALLCFFGSLHAQTTKVYGNLGMENVNISVINTRQGTISDAQGNYMLSLAEKNKRVNLLFSCIGYQDTVVGITPRQLERDSINISFRMQKIDYDLKEVSVVAERPHFEGDWNIVIDIEVYDGTVCMLQGNANKYRLLLADEDIAVFDTIVIPKGIRPEELLKDCMGNCQLGTSDSVYQINLKDKTMPFFATKRERYFAVMGGCLFLTSQHLYMEASAMGGFTTLFYRIDVETKQKQFLFVSDGSDNIADYQDEVNFQAKNPVELVHPVSGSDWDRFVQHFWFNHNSSHLALVGDTLVYFDHDNSKILHYDLDLNKII